MVIIWADTNGDGKADLWVAVLPKHKEGKPSGSEVGKWLGNKLNSVLGGKAVRLFEKDRAGVRRWLVEKVTADTGGGE